MSISTILLDIEGTTTPISFVHDQLFPFAASHAESYLNENYESCQECIALIRQQAKEDLASSDPQGAVEVPEQPDEDKEDYNSVTARLIRHRVMINVREAMQRDRKLTGLKRLQGLIWQSGYESGELQGEVYPDVQEALDRWTNASRPYKIYIYSSGSVSAQKLIFGYSDKGDLTKYLSGYFDTNIGLKSEVASYEKIAKEIDQPVESVLFLTDNPKETKAAQQAGMKSLLLDRPGNAALIEQDKALTEVITSFDAVDKHL